MRTQLNEISLLPLVISILEICRSNQITNRRSSYSNEDMWHKEHGGMIRTSVQYTLVNYKLRKTKTNKQTNKQTEISMKRCKDFSKKYINSIMLYGYFGKQMHRCISSISYSCSYGGFPGKKRFLEHMLQWVQSLLFYHHMQLSFCQMRF